MGRKMKLQYAGYDYRQARDIFKGFKGSGWKVEFVKKKVPKYEVRGYLKKVS